MPHTNMIAYFQSLRARSRIIECLAAWQEGYAYPFFYAILCAVSGLFDNRIYLPLVALQMVLFLFAVLFAKDNRTFLVPVFMAFYSLGCDHPEYLNDVRESLVGVFDLPSLATAIGMGAVMLVSLIVRLYLDGSLAAAFRRKSAFLGGFLLLAAAFLLNGSFSITRTAMDTVYGLLFALGFIVFYVLISSLLEHTERPTRYACVCMVCTTWMMMLQLAAVLFRLQAQDLIWATGADGSLRLAREYIQLSWGYATNIAGLLVLGIPPALYLARNARFSLLSFASAGCFLFGAVLTGSRGAIFGGLAVLLLCLALACFGGKGSKLVRLYTLICLLGSILALLYINRNVRSLSEVWERVRELLRLNIDNFEDSGRYSLWVNGIQDFLSAPVFGVGFGDGGYMETTPRSNIFNDMYHNIFVTFAGATGLCGILALLVHLKDIVLLTLRRFSVNKLILVMLPLTVLITSFFDNFFFYLNFQIFYCAFLILAEKECAATPASLPQNP